jgi:hypothetical protein
MERAAMFCEKSEIKLSLPYEQFRALALPGRWRPSLYRSSARKKGEEKTF